MPILGLGTWTLTNEQAEEQAGYIAIPGSSNLSHIAENYNIFDFELSQDDMNKIKNINKNQRYENW